MILQDDFRDEYDRRAAQIRDWYACDHAGRKEPRLRTLSDGRTAIWEQCTHCGRGLRALSVANFSKEERARLAAFDDSLEEARYHEERAAIEKLRIDIEAKQRAARAEESAEWWQWYDAYLKTPEWKRRRLAVMRRARNLCEGCGTNRAVHVHHLTYERAGNEMLFDLVAVCVGCHQRLHPDRALEVAS